MESNIFSQPDPFFDFSKPGTGGASTRHLGGFPLDNSERQSRGSCAQLCAYHQALQSVTEWLRYNRKARWTRHRWHFVTIHFVPCKSLVSRVATSTNQNVGSSNLSGRSQSLDRFHSSHRFTPFLLFHEFTCCLNIAGKVASVSAVKVCSCCSQSGLTT